MNLEQVVNGTTVRRIALTPGQTIEVGRSTAARLGIQWDQSMSARHFAIADEDGQCRVRDLGSANGTFVNGARIAEAVLRNGDRIEAGESMFVARLSHDTSTSDDGSAGLLAPIPLLEFANHTPLSLATLRWTDLDDKPKLTVVVKATFEIPASGHGVELAPKQLPIFDTDILTNGKPPAVAFESDRVPFKPCADVVLVGRAYAPDGKPVSELIAGVSVGQVRHTVAVIGDRAWETSLLGKPIISPAQSFLTMDLGYERAFGGIDESAGAYCGENHIGTGYIGKQSGARFKKLPNLENPRDLIRAWNNRPRPVGFGFYGRGWAPRLAYAGTYDEQYMKERYPRPPADFSYRFFNGAHPDLQVRGYLRGDEEVVLLNVSSVASQVHFRLPDLVPKITIERWPVPPEQWMEEPATDGSLPSGLRLVEQALEPALDTLVFVPDKGVFYEVFRAVCGLSTLESLEIARVRVTW